jgi:hypothetical protein
MFSVPFFRLDMADNKALGVEESQMGRTGHQTGTLTHPGPLLEKCTTLRNL